MSFLPEYYQNIVKNFIKEHNKFHSNREIRIATITDYYNMDAEEYCCQKNILEDLRPVAIGNICSNFVDKYNQFALEHNLPELSECPISLRSSRRNRENNDKYLDSIRSNNRVKLELPDSGVRFLEEPEYYYIPELNIANGYAEIIDVRYHIQEHHHNEYVLLHPCTAKDYKVRTNQQEYSEDIPYFSPLSHCCI